MTSPAWALLKRDLTATLRGTGAFAMLVLVVGICLFLVALLWPDSTVPLILTGMRARSMFCMFFLAHVMVASLLPPGLAALAFAEDRRQDTLDQLRLSLVTTGGLVGAKLLAAVAVFVLLFVASLPCLGVQLMLVGVATSEVIALIGLAFTTALMGAAMGILCAMVFPRPVVALTMSYVGTGMALGGWILVGAVFFYLLSLLWFDGDIERCITAFLGPPSSSSVNRIIRAAVDAYAFPLNGGSYSYKPWDGVAYRTVIAALCVVSAVLLGRRSTAPAPQSARKLIDAPAALRARRRRFPFYLIDPLRRKPPIPDGANPVFMREWRQSVSYRPRTTVPAFLLTFAVVAMLHVGIAWSIPTSQWTYEDALRAVMLLEIGTLLFVVQIVAASAFAREREQQGADFLHTSLLSSKSIFWGQFCGGAVAALPYLAGMAAACLVSIAAVPFGFGWAPMQIGGFATLLTCVWLTLCIGYFVSAYVKSTAAAIGAGMLANLFVYLWPFLGIAWCESVRSPFLIESGEYTFEHLSPLIAFGSYRWRYGSGAFNSLSIENTLYSTLAMFAALGFLIVVYARSRYERQTRRQ